MLTLQYAIAVHSTQDKGGIKIIMRITWGRLQAGSWQDCEQAYHKMVVGKEAKGLRGHWLAQDVKDADGEWQPRFVPCSLMKITM